MVDSGGKILVVQERGVAQGGTVLLQRHDQPGRRGAGRADRQGPAPDRMQPVLRFVGAGKPSATETGAVGVRSVEQGSGLLSGVQHVSGAHTASDGKKRIRRPKGWFVEMRQRNLGDSKPSAVRSIYLPCVTSAEISPMRLCSIRAIVFRPSLHRSLCFAFR